MSSPYDHEKQIKELTIQVQQLTDEKEDLKKDVKLKLENLEKVSQEKKNLETQLQAKEKELNDCKVLKDAEIAVLKKFQEKNLELERLQLLTKQQQQQIQQLQLQASTLPSSEQSSNESGDGLAHIIPLRDETQLSREASDTVQPSTITNQRREEEIDRANESYGSEPLVKKIKSEVDQTVEEEHDEEETSDEEEAEKGTFGLIKPTLIKQIKKILDQYPDDSQILKELIQNAEDAGAKEVKFLVDYRSYAHDSLYHPGLAKYQGPALYAYNDATFTEDDWKGVQLLSDSIKVKDPTKVGRFGLGFKSVFHITDLPSVISGDHLGIIDPHEKYFNDEDGKRSGFQWHLKRDSKSMRRIPDQFSPYKDIFDCTAESVFQQGEYEGTLFRLPFRKEVSKLSDTIYSKEKIQDLCQTFASDGHLVLLFLMNLERIEFYERDEEMPEPKKLFIVEITEKYKAEVRQARQRFNSKVKAHLSSSDPLSETYRVEIAITDFMGGTNRKSLHSFVITHHISGSNLSTEMQELVNDETLSYMPRVGVALPLNPGKLGIDAREPQGHLFCFLPLPLEAKSLTGLPVHVNGFFALSQNRRHLKWPSVDQKNPKDKSLRWNLGLLREVLPEAYAELIRSLIQTLHMSSETVYTAWPNPNKADKKWSEILEPLWSLLFSFNVFYTNAGGGSWCMLQEVIFDTFNQNDKSRNTIIKLLNKAGKKIVTVPLHVRRAAESKGALKEIKASLLRRTLKACHSCYVDLSCMEKLYLLKFVLSDSKFSDLEGLQLLPLSDKTFTTLLKKPSSSNMVYIDSHEHPRSLLPGMQSKFLDPDIDHDIKEGLKKAMSKGYTQLRDLDTNAVVKHLRAALPSEWMSSNGQVTWYPGKSNHPPLQWLKELWEYFGAHFKHDNGLEDFLGLPLIPVQMKSNKKNEGKIQLARIQRPSPMILKSFVGEELDSSVTKLLNAIGIPVLECLPEFVEIHHFLVPAYINPPTPRGVLNAIVVTAAISKQNHLSLQTDMRAIRGLLSRIRSFTRNEIEFLRKLKLFESHPGSGNKAHPVTLIEVPLAAPFEDFPPVPSHVELVDLSRPNSISLAKLLGTQPMSKEELIKLMLNQALKSMYSDTELDELVKYILHRFGLFRLQQDVDEITNKLRCLSFVICEGTCRKKPKELFDPQDELLKAIFIDEPEKFPKKDSFYTMSNVLVHLRTMGLKGKNNLSANDILNSALMVQKVDDLNKARAKSEAILKHLENVPTLLYDTLVHQLSAIPWVPVFVSETELYPNSLLRKCKIPIDCPKNLVSTDFLSLIGSIKPLVDVQQYPQIAYYFGWKTKPTVDEVISHLQNVINCYEEDKKNVYIFVIKAIYKYLASQDIDGVMAELKKQQIDTWIWNGDGFSSPEEVVIEDPWLDLHPYLCSLPKETKEFVDFFSECGMKRELDSILLLDILRKIKEKHKYKATPREVKRDLQYSLDILNEFIPQQGEFLEQRLRENLLVPVHNENEETLELVPVGECTYCDDYDIDEGEDTNIKFIHQNISIKTAEKLGIPTFTNRFLDVDELEMGECFGQSESLLDRLKGLLEGYTDGLSVPKELIQNADDAGATEIQFLYDQRTNEDAMTHLLDEGMKECQGPALWCYNDAVFTDNDFQNIVKLNAATKEGDTGKIGRFGLGFNSVYNLTDVPSFVSRDSIAILDPHTTFLGKTIRDKRKPGIKFNLSTKTLRRFSNQFMPYNGIFGCDLRSDQIVQKKFYDGTLFRFPLRTKMQARRSEIKQLHYDFNQTKKLLEMILKGSESLLLFTQNILTIRVLHLSNGETETPHELFSISKSCVRVIHKLKSEIALSTAVRKLSNKKKEFVKQSSILKASSKLKQELIKRGTGLPTSQSLLKSSIIFLTESKLSQYGKHFFGGEFARIHPCRSTWLVHSCMVSGTVLKMSFQNKGLLPTAGVAAQLTESPSGYQPKPVVSSAEEACYQSGHIFCFLPLPISSGLPVHINGCFAVDDSRRHLRVQTEDDKGDRGAKWNKVLMTEVVCQAYVGLLQDLKGICLVNSFPYHILWPQDNEILQIHCRELSNAFYRKLCSAAPVPLELFSNGVQWSAIDNVVFLEPRLINDASIKKAVQIALQVFAKSQSLTAIDMPDHILNSFEVYGLKTKIRKHCYGKESCFKEMVFPVIYVLESSVRDCLVLYALDDDSHGLKHLVHDNPCIPASPIGCQLKCPRDLIHPKRKTAQLYEPGDGMFPHGDQFNTDERLLKLTKLGMRDHLEWKEIIERASTVKKLPLYDQALKRTKLLLKLIDDKLKNDHEVDPDIKRDLQKTPFLPILKRPETFLFQWKGDDYKETDFLPAVDLYHKSSKYLVSASEPILDDGKYGMLLLDQSSKVGSLLEIKKMVSMEQAKFQLQTVIATKVAYSNNAGIKELQKACETLYQYFQSRKSKEEVRMFLAPLNFLLIGNQFLNADQIAFNSTITFLPYLHKVPSALTEHLSELLKLVGVRESFEIHDYIKTLKKVKEEHGNRTIDSPMQTKVKEVLQLLSEAIKKVGTSSREEIQKQHGTTYLLDSHGVMRDSGELCIKDCYWMPDEKGIKYANPGIDPQVCLTLGVKSRRQMAISKKAKGIPFGQKEKLTNRLKRILDGYPCDGSIMKELLQNADDAKATKICFIKDPRQHPDERVLEESWKPLQGPALCVYNNAPFTESDIEGIQNLGEGSKGDDPNKTGQYGVGFNAVYHLTDVPSFVSKGKEIGEVMCVFDPNLKYAPCATPESPGVMYTDLNWVRNTFTDVLPCYLEDLGEQFNLDNGTMFRFPLRNDEMAKNSEISIKPVTVQKLNSLINDFEDEMLEALLFVNHVKEISTFEIDNSGDLKTKYHVKASMSEEDEKKRQEFANYISCIGNKLRNKEVSIPTIPARRVSYVLHLEDSKRRCQDWFVVQQIGFGCREDICQEMDVCQAFERGDLGLLPRGGVASLISQDQEKPPGKAFCFLPLPFETGLPVHINGHFALDHEARRNLWRSETGDYRSKWNNILLRQVVAPCYVGMLDEIRPWLSLNVTSDDKTKLIASGLFVEICLSKYESYFPTLDVKDQHWKVLVIEVYRYLGRTVKHIFPVLRTKLTRENQSERENTIEWLSPTDEHDKAFFDNLLESMRCHPKQDYEIFFKSTSALRNTLIGVGFNLIHMSMKIYRSFVESGIEVGFISPKVVLDFFHSYGSGNLLSNQIGPLPLPIESTPFQNVDNLLRVLNYCKEEESFYQTLHGLPLLLTKDNNLRIFDENEPVFVSAFCDLLPNCRQMFLHKRLLFSVFKEHNKDNSETLVFKMFDVTDLARLLPGVLDEPYCGSSGVYRAWNPLQEESKLPNERWILRIWKFFHHLLKPKFKEYDDQVCQENVSPTSSETTHSKSKPFKEELLRKTAAKKKQIILETLNPVIDCCLLPATQVVSSQHLTCNTESENQVHFLVPIVMSQTVFFSRFSYSQKNMRDTIKHLCLPELNSIILSGSVYSTSRHDSSSFIAELIVSNLDDPRSFLTVLMQKMKSNPVMLSSRLQKDDYVNVLRYFNDHKEMLQKEDVEDLKLLPLYPTVHGDHISISKKQAFVLPSRIPKNDMNKWEEKAGIVFLSEDYNLAKLYSFLGCDSKDEVDVYCDIIFQRFQDMSKDARLVHLTFLRNLLFELENELDACKEKKEKLLQCLYNLEFDLGQDGSLRRASSLYDPSESDVFKVMFENRQNMFPAAPFCNSNWLSFLRRIGLIYEVTNEMFIQFAREVEMEVINRGKSKQNEAKSKILVSFLFEKENLATNVILDEVKDICFIFPENIDDHLKQIHQPLRRDLCICFKDSAILSYSIKQIAWTTVSILPDYANPFHCRVNFNYGGKNRLNNHTYYIKQIIARLGVLESPTVEMVVKHCKNICQSLCKRKNDGPNRDYEFKDADVLLMVMKSIYEFLQNKFQNNESVIEVELQNIQCVLVEDGKRFVYPRQVVIEMMPDDEIHPYLFKVPRHLAVYSDLFQNLGSTVMVTAAQYAMVLDSIHSECGDAKLNPNEITKAFKATKGLFESIKKDAGKPLEIEMLFLPGVRRDPDDTSLNLVYLRKSIDIFYNDAPHFKERLKGCQKLLLVKLKECQLKTDNDDQFIQLLKSFRPVELTTIVQEKIVQQDQFALPSPSRTLTLTLNSNEFFRGLLRLIKHTAYHHGSQIKEDLEQTIRESLQRVHVYSVSGLRTRLVCEETTIPESEADVSCFEEKNQENGWNIYVEKNVELTEYISRVAEIVDRITGNQLGDALVHLPTMLLRPLDKIQSYLDVLKVREDNSFLEASCFPSPGSFIQVEDQHLLVDDFTVFHRGEYVGYELDDPSLRNEDGTPTYIYAIVIEEITSNEASSSTKRYRIDIGEEEIEVDAEYLYKFYRCKQNEDIGMEMEVFTGSDASEETYVKPVNLDEAKRKVQQTLEEAWNLPEEKRKRIIKRLFLTWHPDKNPGNEKLCTEVFKFILAEIQRLERNEEFDDLFSRWTSRAHSHRNQRSSFFQRAQSSRSRGGFFGRGFPSSSGRRNPQPGQAARWYKQAKADLDVVNNDLKTFILSCEWACFKCHQSAEKALKAAQYSKDANLKSNTHDLPEIASSLDNPILLSLATSLERLLGSSPRMRYPDLHCFSIPHDTYTVSMATQALEYATKILNEVKANFID